MFFTDCQENAIHTIEKFLIDEKEYIMRLEGSAGTGKSTVIIKFEEKYEDLNIIYTAPTHKAVKVLRDMGKKNPKYKKQNYLTLQKFFKLKVEYKQDGKTELRKNGNVCIKKDSVLIIDEISMISKDLYDIITKEIIENNIKTICLGDRCQLPPIYKIDAVDDEDEEIEQKVSSMTIETLSPFFGDFKYTCLLKKIKRTENKALKDLYDIFRQYTLDNNTDNFKSNLLQFKKLNISPNIKIETSKNHFTKEINENIEREEAYVICAKRNTVKEYVDSIKKRLYPNSKYPFNEGEKIYITNYFCFDNKLECDCTFNGRKSLYCNKNVFYTSQEYRIKSCNKLRIKSDYFDATYDCYEYEITYILHDLSFLKVRTICDSSIDLFKKNISDKQAKIKKIKDNSKLWAEFYYHKHYVQSPFTSSIAITAYKSQGSTYNYVFVDGSDIEQCRRTTFLKTKELYTAITRTRKYICIFIELENKYTEIPSNILKCTRCRCWKKHNQFRLNKKGIFVKTCIICSEKALLVRTAKLCVQNI
jgi:hypothetical protein